MKINTQNFELALARAKKTMSELANDSGLSKDTITHIRVGNNVRPITIGKIAESLGVDVAEIADR